MGCLVQLLKITPFAAAMHACCPFVWRVFFYLGSVVVVWPVVAGLSLQVDGKVRTDVNFPAGFMGKLRESQYFSPRFAASFARHPVCVQLVMYVCSTGEILVDAYF